MDTSATIHNTRNDLRDTILSVAYIDTPIGKLKVVANQSELVEVRVATGDDKVEMVGDETETHPIITMTRLQLAEYFRGERQEFTIPLSTPESGFTTKVWHQLARIPYGHTMSYAQVARACGSPKAARAVGNACNQNKHLIVLPCHRVISSDGRSLVGFAPGVEYKRWLLDLEKAHR